MPTVGIDCSCHRVHRIDITALDGVDGDGEFLTTLIESEHCDAVLTGDFGIEKAGHRLLFISRLRKLCRASCEGSEMHFASCEPDPKAF